MITLHMTDAEILNSACHSDMQLCLRTELGAEMLVHPGCWPVQRLPIRSHLFMPSIVQCVERTILWCDAKSPAVTRPV